MNIPTYQEYNGDEQSYKELLSKIIRVALDNMMLEVHHKQNECTPEQMYDITVKVRSMSEKGITGYQLAQEEGWIDVRERLPEKSGFYICWCSSPSEPGLIHYHVDTGWQNGFYDDRVTHWQQIEPPKIDNQIK